LLREYLARLVERETARRRRLQGEDGNDHKDDQPGRNEAGPLGSTMRARSPGTW